MRIDFNDGGYVEFSKSSVSSIHIIVAAKNSDRTLTVNSAEISSDELDQLLSDVIPNKPATKKKTAKKKTTKKSTRKKNEDHTDPKNN